MDATTGCLINVLMMQVRWKVVAWHPEVATQLCLASEEDLAPVIQLWDLRFATSPIRSLESHQRGVLSIAWCTHDPDLLLSCGKDNRILCWNPNSNVPVSYFIVITPECGISFYCVIGYSGR